jgi:hypothetical protein
MRRINKGKGVICTASQFRVGQLFIPCQYANFSLRVVSVIMILVDSNHNWRGIDQGHRE